MTAHPGRLRHRVGAAIARHRLWSPSDRVAVAVSGGLDSVALLDLLLETRDWHGAALEVVTVDHGTRPGSAADAQFVATLAADRGVRCAVIAVQPGSRSEAAARDARYAAFDALDVDRVALAHHRDDLAETVVLQLLRGTGTAGLGGIRPRRGRYVRPLLDVARADLARWAAHRGLGWRDDPTNADPRYLRNRVRAEVMPLLEALRPGAGRALARSAALAALDDEWLSAAVVDGPPWPRAFVAEGPEPVVRRSLIRGLPGLGASGVDAVLRAARAGPGEVQVPRGSVRVDADVVWFVPRSD
ncbi:MAG: tRNA lysidine(34) synthetase TilS [Myxococcota bacterium]